MDGDRGLVARRDRSDRPRRLVLIVSVAFVAGACTGSSNAASPSGSNAMGSTSGGSTTPSGPTVTTIPQPTVPANIPVAPESERVDLAMPTFSDPTNVTNPLFPVSLQDSVLMLGRLRTTLAGVQPST
ncbi:MAG TPA: hypothetical protein VJZ98_08750 [Actinomycetota bacterium]|nr:hypothetical protein [Actinomycetota bacterium]